MAYVPENGPGLYGYTLTRIDRTITAEAQTIYFYGEAIPEPATCMLMLFAASAHLCARACHPYF
jgi:hypothetical protein